MKKIINAPETYVDDMLKGIYAAHGDQVKYAEGDLRCYCTANKKTGKVAIITGGGSGHLPLFLGYVGDGLIDGCGVGGVFQSPSPEQIYNIAKEVEAGADIIMLDNMSDADMRAAVQLIAGRAQTECSGNVTKENIARLKDIGVDFVSSGALTHSAPILDLSMKHLRPLDKEEA